MEGEDDYQHNNLLVSPVHEEMTATSLNYNAIIGPVNMLSISEVCLE